MAAGLPARAPTTGDLDAVAGLIARAPIKGETCNAMQSNQSDGDNNVAAWLPARAPVAGEQNVSGVSSPSVGGAAVRPPLGRAAVVHTPSCSQSSPTPSSTPHCGGGHQGGVDAGTMSRAPAARGPSHDSTCNAAREANAHKGQEVKPGHMSPIGASGKRGGTMDEGALDATAYHPRSHVHPESATGA